MNTNLAIQRYQVDITFMRPNHTVVRCCHLCIFVLVGILMAVSFPLFITTCSPPTKLYTPKLFLL